MNKSLKIIDLHCDTIGEIRAGENFLNGIPTGHVDIPRMQSGHIGIIVLASFVSSIYNGEKAYLEAKSMLELTRQTCLDNSEHLNLIDNFESAKQILPSNKIGIIPAVENGHAINNNITHLESFRKLGARYMTLTHSSHLDWAASSGDLSKSVEGLSDFGIKVIHAMNDLNIIVDASHVHSTTFWDAIKYSRKPIIASHSNAYNICPTARNLKDDQIKAIADKGGMIGINFFPGFLDSNYQKKLKIYCSDLFDALDIIESKYKTDIKSKKQSLYKFYTQLQSRMRNQLVTTDKIVEHIEYIVNLVGEDFVGFGSDFDGVPSIPQDINGIDGYSKIIQKLQKKFDNPVTLEKIAYKNILRVLKENE